MNKNVKRKPILEHPTRLFFICMLVFSAVTLFFNPYAALGEFVVSILLYVVYRCLRLYHRRLLSKEVDTLTLPGTSLPPMSLLNLPLPTCVVRVEDGAFQWGSPSFVKMLGRAEPAFDVSVKELIPKLPLKWLKEGKTECPVAVELRERVFKVYGSMARKEDSEIMALLHWVDITELTRVRQEIEAKQPVVGVIVLDNYEEIVKGLQESPKAALLAGIDDRINEFCQDSEGILCKMERDRFSFFCEYRHLGKMIEKKFYVLESVREMTGGGGIPATLSIGLGTEGATLQESLAFANLALDMALSRGGDQVVVKNKLRFDFYGGMTKELEKRTKVKSRVMANALRELMGGASSVLLMGHGQSDLDAIGAAAGLAALSRTLGRRVHIVVDRKHTSAAPLIDRLAALKEYQGVFIGGQEAMLMADRDTLLLVVDTSRPELVESPELLQTIHKIAVIDHHRRAATYIDQATLTFHEPYASSTCELVCELLQYSLEQGDLLRDEAEGMLAGIAMDTKNFTLHTGVRTFEAAAYLKAAGADTVSVKRLFQSDLQDNLARYQVISDAEMIADQVAIAASERSVSRVIAAQAADELLSVSGIQASFVLTPLGDQVMVSARSLGDINVQVIAEKIGGGGHQTSAGAQLNGVTVLQGKALLIDAINEYFAERG